MSHLCSVSVFRRLAGRYTCWIDNYWPSSGMVRTGEGQETGKDKIVQTQGDITLISPSVISD